MKLFELLSFSGDILRHLNEAGIKRTSDYLLVNLYKDYVLMKSRGQKITYIISILSDRYKMSERKVYDVIRRLSADCKNIAV